MVRPDSEQRFGIPSLSGGALRWFYGLFSVGTVYLTAANTISEVSGVNATDWMQVQSIATEQLVRGAGASLIIAYILADGGDMVISAILRERNRLKDLEARQEAKEQGRETGLEQGRAETQALWEAWLQRREEAESRDEPFDEPPPSINSQNGSPTGTSGH